MHASIFENLPKVSLLLILFLGLCGRAYERIAIPDHLKYKMRTFSQSYDLRNRSLRRSGVICSWSFRGQFWSGCSLALLIVPNLPNSLGLCSSSHVQCPGLSLRRKSRPEGCIASTAWLTSINHASFSSHRILYSDESAWTRWQTV